MSNLPIHPELEKLNLPPMPWHAISQQRYYCDHSMCIWDGREIGVATVESLAYKKNTEEFMVRSEAQVIATANVLAAAPDMLNWLLLYREMGKDPISREAYDAWVQAAGELDAIIARALGTNPNP